MHYALWWVPEGNIPDVLEAKERREYRELYGDTEKAFSFQNLYEPKLFSETSQV